MTKKDVPPFFSGDAENIRGLDVEIARRIGILLLTFYLPFICKVRPLSLCALYMESSHMVLHASLYIHAL